MDPSVETVTLRSLTFALDAAARQHVQLAYNIANANTEGFISHRLDFPAFVEARRQLDQGRPLDAEHLRALQDDLKRPVQLQLQGMGGASVQLDAEVASMARNAVHFQALLKGVSSQLGLLSIAVTDGKR